MPRRAASTIVAVTLLVAAPTSAHAAGAWLSSSSVTPVEQRIALAVGPTRTTLWTSLRFASPDATVAIVVPAPTGTTLDLSSDAWFEALEVATAPRILPPEGFEATCGSSEGLLEVDGHVGNQPSLRPDDLTILDSAASVKRWAEQAGIAVPPLLDTAFGAQGSVSFVGVRLSARRGTNTTPTLRLVMPGAPAMLPLVLTRAGSMSLRVTAWVLGPGRANLVDAPEVVVQSSDVVWHEGEGASNYTTAESNALAIDSSAFLVEGAGHSSLATPTTLPHGSGSIDDVVSTFFQRARAYGDGDMGTDACTNAARLSLLSSQRVAASCPRGSLGSIGSHTTCVESPRSNEVDPSTLRCGSGADDLAVALSESTPVDIWLNRLSLNIAAGSGGEAMYVAFSKGDVVAPVLYAGAVDSPCTDGGAPIPGGQGSSSGGAVSGPVTGGGSRGGTSSGSSEGSGSDTGSDVVGVVNTAAEIADLSSGCSCSGSDSSSDTTDSGDGCSGSSDSESSSDSCGGGSDNSSSGCSGSESGGDSCGSSESGGSCGGGDDFKCTSARGRLRTPKLSILVLGALAVVAPLRRRGRRSRP